MKRSTVFLTLGSFFVGAVIAARHDMKDALTTALVLAGAMFAVWLTDRMDQWRVK